MYITNVWVTSCLGFLILGKEKWKTLGAPRVENAGVPYWCPIGKEGGRSAKKKRRGIRGEANKNGEDQLHSLLKQSHYSLYLPQASLFLYTCFIKTFLYDQNLPSQKRNGNDTKRLALSRNPTPHPNATTLQTMAQWTWGLARSLLLPGPVDLCHQAFCELGDGLL